MMLRRAIAVPFRTEGTDRLQESEVVVALSLDRGWFSPDGAKQLIETAATEGLVSRDDGAIVPAFDPDDVSIPDGFEPDDSVLEATSTFERILATLVEADIEKQRAVAACNQLQSDLGITLEAAALLYAKRQEVDVAQLARRAQADLSRP